MARIYPFRALRYDPQKVRMEDVVTQPYDKITPAMQQAYYDRSKYNLIRVILGKREPTDTDVFAPDASETPQHNVYTRAAESLASWRKKAILREESEPALYGYSQEYTVPGTSSIQTRRGFIALGHLYDYADHIVYRHEQTFPKHKSDRLALFKATRTYCEQIYMLYSDPAFTAEQLIFESGNPAALEITDEYNVLHRVWKLTDPRRINLIVTAMADKKLIIADGHHRYETSVAYMHERATELGLPQSLSSVPEGEEPATDWGDPDESPSNLADEPHASFLTPAFPEAAMMMTFVNMDAPGITILPTHRVVFGLKDFSTTDFIGKASQYFSVNSLNIDQSQSFAGSVPSQTSEEQQRRRQSFVTMALADLEKTPGTAFVMKTEAGYHLLTPKPEAISEQLKQLHPEITPRQAALDVVQLHRLILEHLLGLTHESIANTENIRYLRDPAEAIAQVDAGEADLAFLIKPVTLDQLRDISLSGDVMPQKSTDFYPKLLSGLAMYALD